MSDFLDWHPSSAKAAELYAIREKISEALFIDPVKTINCLQTDWNFGKVSEIWDDFIFENCIRSVLDKNSSEEIKAAVRRYSAIDHALFTTYIRREESPVRFRRAFWNVNYYGKLIASKLSDSIKLGPNSFPDDHNNLAGKKKIAFVMKGPYKLAHVEFLHSFLRGSKIFNQKVDLHLILLDDIQAAPKGIDHVSIVSLSNLKDPYQKVQAYIKYCVQNNLDHICWVACVQNLTMYMGMQLAKTQSYWSMKYHSIIMPSIQKYAGLGFGGESFYFDDKKWFRGRAFPDLQMPSRDSILTSKLRKSFHIPNEAVLVGCFVRSEKLYDKEFWNSVIAILKSASNIHFAIASQGIPGKYVSFLKSQHPSLRNRFHSLGWVNTKNWSFALDVYFDSSPRGSCNTIFEAIEADVPVLLADSMHNRESSALPYLASAAKSLGFSSTVPGVYLNEEERLNTCLSLLINPSKRSNLAAQQKQLLKSLQGQQHLFAKDYLNFFLDQNYKISNLS